MVFGPSCDDEYKRQLVYAGHSCYYTPLDAVANLGDVKRLPKSLKVLLENLLRHRSSEEGIAAILARAAGETANAEIAYRPARVLMQDFTGVPAVVDLAAMRDAIQALGGDPELINPLTPVDLVIDHSVMVDYFAHTQAFQKNVVREFERNHERYALLRWAQSAFRNFRVVPPGTGICHQVNIEYLASVVRLEQKNNEWFAFPDTVVGTDSHTTMVNGLAVLGWGVGGIEAEAVMLGQPVSMQLPEVVGVRITGKPRRETTATDLVLTVTELLRNHGVVGRFVEFFGPGLGCLTLEDRATIANMAPEYGATCGFFPIDDATLAYLRLTGRKNDQIALVEAYAKAQGFWCEDSDPDPVFSEVLDIDLSTIETSLAGPKRPQDRVILTNVPQSLATLMPGERKRVPVPGTNYDLGHGDVVIAAITSCTNTSNPDVMLSAALLARRARERGLQVPPWVKTSLAPGSQIVSDYLKAAGLDEDLNDLGFHLVGYGCTTCIGNSGPLSESIASAVDAGDLTVCSILSGNRNFEGRINPHVRANYLASPPLVIAYALAGTLCRNLTIEPLGNDKDGCPVMLDEIWPSYDEIRALRERVVSPDMFRARYDDVFSGTEEWRAIPVTLGQVYAWDKTSTYVRRPPFLEEESCLLPAGDIKGARSLAVLADSVTTDHISPAGAIRPESPAGCHLIEHNVAVSDFNSYGARRGNHEVMMRGTFANIRIRNAMVPDKEGGFTVHQPSGEVMTIYDASTRYRAEGVPLIVIAGKEYGTGSSRDWAAKGTRLLGVVAIIAESFERIHRSNLVGMGVLPLEFANGFKRDDLNLEGSEFFDIVIPVLKPHARFELCVHRAQGKESMTVPLLCRIDTQEEQAYYCSGGILPYVITSLGQASCVN